MLPDFAERVRWFQKNRPDLCANIFTMNRPGVGERRLLSLVGPDRLRRILARMLDESEFLSPHGLRSLVEGARARARHARCSAATTTRSATSPASRRPACSAATRTGAARCGSRVNYLMIESLQRFHHYLGPDFTVEMPTGSGQLPTSRDVAAELSRRLIALFFLMGEGGARRTAGTRAVRLRSALAGPRHVLRVLPRRLRQGPRRGPPDRLDRARRQAHPPKRLDTGVTVSTVNSRPVLSVIQKACGPDRAQNVLRHGRSRRGCDRRGRRRRAPARAVPGAVLLPDRASGLVRVGVPGRRGPRRRRNLEVDEGSGSGGAGLVLRAGRAGALQLGRDRRGRRGARRVPQVAHPRRAGLRGEVLLQPRRHRLQGVVDAPRHDRRRHLLGPVVPRIGAR